MKLIGITGGVGMGKTACSDWLLRQHHPVVDTDAIARELTINDPDVLAAIRREFGGEVFEPSGTLNRGALADLVFNEKSQRLKLEAILHPRIRVRWRGTAEEWRNKGAALGFVVIPLLYETAAEANFESVVCVACSADTQFARLTGRGWSPEQIKARVLSQMSTKDKMDRAKFVIWTEGKLESTEEQLKMVLRRMTE